MLHNESLLAANEAASLPWQAARLIDPGGRCAEQACICPAPSVQNALSRMAAQHPSTVRASNRLNLEEVSE
jgi:hypothetical protein